MTNDEIYGLFCAADYSNLKLLQVLADVAGIDVHELLNIIEKKENGIMAQHKWTDEENAELMRLHGYGVKCGVIAAKFGTSEANIRWRIRMLRKKGVQGTTDNPDNTDTTLIGAIAQSEADNPTNAAIVDEIEAVENEAVENLHPCRNVYEMARDAIVEIERMAGGMVADRIEITAIDNRISAAARDEECNEVTFSRRLEE